MKPEFRLPWEFTECGSPLEADAVVRGSFGVFGDRDGEFWLKKRLGRLFFRHSRDKGRIFAVATPCEAEGNGLVSFFEEALALQDIQRLVTFPHLWDRDDEAIILMLWSGRSKIEGKWMCRVEVREWWGGNWIETYVASAESQSVLHPSWRMSWSSPHQVRAQLHAQPLPEATRHELELRWTRGSLGELRALAQAFEKVFPESAEECGLARFRPASAWGECEFQQMPLFQPWRDLFASNFHAVGIEMEPIRGRDLSLRSGWRFNLPRIPVWENDGVEFSAHERLEAQLFLRDWLRKNTNYSEEQIRQLFA